MFYNLIHYPATRYNTKETTLTLSNDDVCQLLRLVVEVLEDLLCTARVAQLSVERGARVVWDHAIAAIEEVLYAAPWVLLRRGLDVPDIRHWHSH